MQVVLVRWPLERERLEQLRTEGRPRLLLVQDQATPPPGADELEDWIRLPANQADLHARMEGLLRRAAARAAPELDEDGVLAMGDRRVSLSPLQARLVAALLGRFGAVVSREALVRAGWPGGARTTNSLDVQVLRLRRRLAPLCLAIRTVRSRGYLLEPANEASPARAPEGGPDAGAGGARRRGAHPRGPLGSPARAARFEDPRRVGPSRLTQP